MVGASLGVALGGSGLRAAVVEAVPYGDLRQPSYDDRSVALAYGSKRIFTAMKVWDLLAQSQDCPAPIAVHVANAAGVTAIRRIHISDRGHFGFAHLDSSEVGVEALGYVVENRVLGAALAARLKATPDTTLLQPATVADVDFAGDYPRVSIEHDGVARKLSARLVVAADGGDSTVRTIAGIAAQRSAYSQTAIVTNITAERAHDGTAFERFTESGPLALLPMSENRCSVVWSLAPGAAEEIIRLPDTEFLDRLQHSFGERLGRFTRVGTRHAYALALTRVKEQVRPRLALIGNAAHTLHPVAGQGFNLGLRDVASLAQVLVDAQSRGDDIGDLTVLRTYADWRARDNIAVSGFTDGIVRIFSNRFGPLVFARNLGLLAVDLMPAVKRGLMRRTMGLAGRLPRLACGLPLL